MNTLKHPVALVVIGVLLGYSLSRVLDQVPLVNRIPKVRIG
jgi:hypothetical protein